MECMQHLEKVMRGNLACSLGKDVAESPISLGQGKTAPLMLVEEGRLGRRMQY